MGAAESNTDDRFELERFLNAQAGIYDQALEEIEAGKKRSHWMWFIFPQIAGLGESYESKFYAIRSLDEARDYLADRVLGPRLRSISHACLKHRGRTAEEIFGSIDALKLRSSMTLFAQVAEPHSVFEQVLEAFFDSEPDVQTLRLLEKQAGATD